MSRPMPEKKPVWITPEAHAALSDYSQRVGRPMKAVLSELIIERLAPDERDEHDRQLVASERLGGVWVV